MARFLCLIGIMGTGLGALATGAAIENEAWAWVGVGAASSLVYALLAAFTGAR